MSSALVCVFTVSGSDLFCSDCLFVFLKIFVTRLFLKFGNYCFIPFCFGLFGLMVGSGLCFCAVKLEGTAWRLIELGCTFFLV